MSLRGQDDDENGGMEFAPRKKLPHARPSWTKDTDPIFLTICCNPRGKNQLANDSAWRALATTAEGMLEESRWNPRLMLAMPDHVHLIADIPRLTGIPEAIRLFKAKTAITAPIDWQRDAFDHRIRNETAIRAKWHYILMNPVRAKLCAVPSDWPYQKTWPRNRSPQGEPR